MLRQQARDAAENYLDAMLVTTAAAEPDDLARSADVEALLQNREVVEKAVRRTQDERRTIAQTTAATLISDPEIVTGMKDRIESILVTQAGKQAARLVTGSREPVQNIIDTALKEGWTVPQTASTIRETLTNIAPWRATMLARTDLIGISNGTSQVAAQSLGDEAPLYKEWLATNDDRTRPEHVEADGQVVPLDQPFDVDGIELLYPGDPDGPDELVINCRCSMVYVDAPEGADRTHSDLQAAAERGGDVPYKIETRDGKPCVVNSDTGETEKCHETEQEAKDHLAALYANVPDARLTAAADYSGSMIALYPRREEALSLAQEGGEEPERIHQTLAVLTPGFDVNTVAILLAHLARELEPLYGQVSATSTLDTAGATIALPDVPGLNELRALVVMALDELGVGYETNHGFLPHLTLGYGIEEPDDLTGIPLSFEAVCLVIGMEEKLSFPLQGQETEDLTEIEHEHEEGMALEPFPEEVYDEGVGEMGTNVRTASAAVEAARVPRRQYVADTPPSTRQVGAAPLPDQLTAAAAGTAPLLPPASWFEDPQLDGPTGITVTADGRLYGHAALWGTCHTGVQGRCQTPPPGSDYRYFHLGLLETEEGQTIPVGKLTVGTGHASIRASRADVVGHYDNTGWVGAHVRAGEDEHGIWIAGALQPDISAEQARVLRATSVSGDWRRINGQMELLGLLAVNIPGFPVPRAEALVASSDEVLAIVAVGIPGFIEEQEPDPEALWEATIARLTATAIMDEPEPAPSIFSRRRAYTAS